MIVLYILFFDDYIQFDEEEYDLEEEVDLEEENDTIDRNLFYDNGVNDMDLCSDDNTYTNQQN